MLWELSTPFVHLRWLLHKSGREKKKAYSVNAAVMLVVFFLCRPVWGTWLSYKVTDDQQQPFGNDTHITCIDSAVAQSLGVCHVPATTACSICVFVCPWWTALLFAALSDTQL